MTMQNFDKDAGKIASDPAVTAAVATTENSIVPKIPASVRVWLYPWTGALISAGAIVSADSSVTGVWHTVALAVTFLATGWHTALATANTKD